MSMTVQEFWNVLQQSLLLSPSQMEHFGTQWKQMKGQTEGSARPLAEWLVAENILSRYQAAILLAGKSGPFQFGAYTAIDLISKGRLKGLYRAVHSPTKHPVLLQFFPADIASDPMRWEMTKDQFSIYTKEVRPNICVAHEIVEANGYRFAVWENLKGESLDRLLGNNRKMPVDEACRAAMFAAIGLSHWHSGGFAYGEARPESLWVEPHGNPKWLLGPLVREAGLDEAYFHLAEAEKNPRMRKRANYLAPELSGKNAIPTPAGDQYGLGCMLFQMLSGSVPFTGNSAADVVQQHITENIPSLSPQKVPSKLRQLVATLLAKEPVLRMKNMTVVATALAEFVPAEKVRPRLEPPIATLSAYLTAKKSPPDVSALPPQPKQQSRPPVVPSNTQPPVPPEAHSETDSVPKANVPIAPILDTRETKEADRKDARPVTEKPAIPPIVENVAIGNPPVEPRAVGHIQKPKKFNKTTIALATVGLLVAVAGILYAMGGGSNVHTSGTNDENAGKQSASVAQTNLDKQERGRAGGANQPEANSANEQQHTADTAIPPKTISKNAEKIIADDGSTLWASPTHGSPVSLSYLPPGIQCFIILRPKAMAEFSEWPKIEASLGPWGMRQRKRLETISGVSFDQMDQAIIGLDSPNSTRALRASMVLRLKSGVSAAEIAKRQGKQKSRFEKTSFYATPTLAYFAPEDENDRVLVIAPVDSMPEIIAAEKEAPPLRREMEQLFSTSDSDRHVTIVCAPNFLFADGAKIFQGGGERLQKQVDWFLGDSIQAVAVSLHWDKNFFAELRLAGTLDRPAHKMVKEIHKRWAMVPGRIEDYVLSLNSHPYGRKLIARFPEMLRRLSHYTRSGTENDQALLRAYLPLSAGHNLLMASELALAETPGGANGLAGTPENPTKPKTTLEKLEQKTTLSFPRDTLEMAVKMLAEDSGIEMIILGGDLQLEGITKNQSFGLDEKDKRVEDILIAILRLSNPDKTATAPNDPKQKILYVVKPKKPGGENIVYITTRAAAEKRGDTLPKAFQLKK